AELVLTDLVDLVSYAGCEPGRDASRFGPDLALPLMLLVPTLVQGRAEGRAVERFPIGQRAIPVLEPLVGKDSLSREALGESDLDLESLYGTFYKKTRAHDRSGWTMILAPPPRLTPDGRFDRPDQLEQVWKDFDRWARIQSRVLKGR